MEVSAGEKCDKCTVKRQNQADGVIIVPRCAPCATRRYDRLGEGDVGGGGGDGGLGSACRVVPVARPWALLTSPHLLP